MMGLLVFKLIKKFQFFGDIHTHTQHIQLIATLLVNSETSTFNRSVFCP